MARKFSLDSLKSDARVSGDLGPGEGAEGAEDVLDGRVYVFQVWEDRIFGDFDLLVREDEVFDGEVLDPLLLRGFDLSPELLI